MSQSGDGKIPLISIKRFGIKISNKESVESIKSRDSRKDIPLPLLDIKAEQMLCIVFILDYYSTEIAKKSTFFLNGILRSMKICINLSTGPFLPISVIDIVGFEARFQFALE